MVKIIIVTKKKNGEQSFEIDVKTTDVLSKVREELEKKNGIDDELSFSKNFEGEYVEISRGNEDDFKLEDIIERDSNKIFIVNATKTYWKFMNKLHQLDEGWMISEGTAKRAKKKAIILQTAEIITAKEEKVVTDQKEMDLFISVSNDSFVPSESYRIYIKAYFEIGNFKLNKTFTDEVEKAIEDKDIKKIIEEYGQIIPTKIIFGGRTKDTNVESLKYCRSWNCMKFEEKKNIFHFVEPNLREKIYSFLGKKILCSTITTEPVEKGDNDVYKTKKIKLPQEVSKIISNNDSCSIFATAVGMKNHYYCQILKPTDKKEEPKLMIHYLNNDKEILVGWIVIGYDLYLQYTSEDKYDILKKNYISYGESDNKTFEFLDLSNHYCVGIPIVEKEDLLIGHYFSEDYKELRIFAYSLKDKKCVKLPTFSFDVLSIQKQISDPDVPEKKKIDIPFEKNMITVENHYKEFNKFPKFISLYSDKSEYRQIFLNQQLSKIEVHCLDDKDSSKDLKCSFFIPFKSDDPEPDNYYQNNNKGIFKMTS